MLAIENVEGANPALNLAVRAQEVRRAQPDRGVHAGKKRDPLEGQRDARGDVEVCGRVSVGLAEASGEMELRHERYDEMPTVMMWGMGLVWLLVIILLVLGIAGLVKNLRS